MRAPLLALVLLVAVLAGCAENAPPQPPPAVQGAPHVLVVGGTVVESGPEPEPQGVCDVAAPPFSADDDEARIWYVPTEWHDADPRGAELVVVRVDRTEWLWDDDCWAYRLEAFSGDGMLRWWHDEIPQGVPARVVDGGVEVDGVLLRPGDETAWQIDETCSCTQHSVEGTYRYEGTLHVQYLGAWGENSIVVTDFDRLPPLDVPYWDGWT